MKTAMAILCILASLSLSAQHDCGFDKSIDHLLRSNATLYQQLDKQEALIRRRAAARSGATPLITVPVVVHVMHLGEPVGTGSNISDAQIESAIQRLNAAFAGARGFTGPDAQIRFALAEKSVDCQRSSGIIRIDARGACVGLDCYEEKGVTDANVERVKDLSNWPSAQYLNIWVVTEIEDNDGGSGIQGTAMFPGLNPAYDGIVILHQVFGYDPTGLLGYTLKASGSSGMVLVHEAGHSLGLYHTFEGDDYNRDGQGDRCPSYTGCGPYNGDCVADTPPHRRSRGDCREFGINVCDGGTSNALFVHNIMNYSSQTCQTEFTPGQIKRMRTTLEEQRAGWVLSTSDQDLVHQEPAQGCEPQTRFLPNAFGLGVRSVSLGATTHTSGTASDDGGYLNNWCSSFSVDRGGSYRMVIHTGDQNAQNVKVYGDFNADGRFDEGKELLLRSDRKKVHQGTVRIPTYAKVGSPLRLRVIATYSGFTIGHACFQPYFGQVEDYTVMVSTQGALADAGSTDPLSIDLGHSFQDIPKGFADDAFDVFPNPTTSDRVMIRSSGGRADFGRGRIEILDARGQVLLSQQAKAAQLVAGLDVQLFSLQSGLYHVRVITDQGTFSERLIRL